MIKGNIKIAIMAGGTGGHIFPGIAVANELIQMGHNVIWLGAIGGMEEQLVKKHNIPIKLLAIKGLRGKGVKGLLTMPFKLVTAMRHAGKYFKQENVQAVISMGGYVAGPGGLVAKLKGIPLLVHEQNSKFGMTNRYLAKWATKTLTGFNLNGIYNSQWVGNPVRKDIETLSQTKKESNKINLFILGGSLGAMSLNTRIPALLNKLISDGKITVKHQCGKNNKGKTLSNYQNTKSVEVLEFIDNMPQIYAWADFVIARAGALTIAEINAVGLPAIFVPYPHAVDDHQTSNAQNIVDNSAGYIWQEKDSLKDLQQHIETLVNNENQRNTMALNSKALHKQNSALKVAQLCLEMVA